MRKSIFRFVLAALLLLSSAVVPVILAQCDHTAQRIIPGQPMAGSVAGIQTTYYRFEVAAPGTYNVYTSGDVDTYGQLLDAKCQVLDENDDGGGDYGYNFYIARQLPAGTYYVSVRGYNQSVTGPFTLHVEVEGGQAAGGDCAGAQNISFGSSVEGYLNGTTPIYYRVVLPEGPVRIYTSGNLDTVGQAFDADCNAIDENDDGGEGTNFLLEGDAPAGTYYIAVRGYSDNVTGPFTLHVEAGDGGQQVSSNCDNALPVNVGGSASGMTQGQTLQYYSFRVTSTGTYNIYTSGDTDTVGMLLDTNCQMLTENDDGGDSYGLNFHIEQYLDIPGTYYVAVGGYRETAGPYTLHIEVAGGQQGGSNCDNALPVNVGGSASGMAQGQTLQYYSFRVTSAGTYSIYTSGDTDTVGMLLDTNCQMLTENDDSDSYGLNFHIEQYLDIPGTYYVAVGGYRETAGPYTLHIEGAGSQQVSSNCDNALPLNVGGSAAGMAQGQTLQYYSFRVTSAGIYSIYTSGDTDTVGMLLDTNCQMLSENDDGGGDYGYNFHIEQYLDIPGTYYVAVGGYREITGPYTLYIEGAGGQAEGGDCAGAQDVPFGGSVDGVLNGTTPIYYRFISPGGQARAYTTGNLDTVGQALDANCQVIAENDDGGEGTNFLIEGEVPAGTYYISVRGYSDNVTGPFTLHVEGIGGGGQTGGSDCSNALPLGIGGSVSGTVQGQTMQFYSFQVAAPDAYNIYTSGNADTYGQLLDANCQVIAENDDGGGTYSYNFHIEERLSPGTYYVSVRGYNQNITGPFTLHIEGSGAQPAADCATALEIPSAGSVEGVLDGTTPIYYRFTSPGGQARAYTTGNLDTVGMLLDSNCQTITENDDGGGDHGYNFYIERQLASGTYYLSVRGYSENVAGAFTLHVEGIGGGGQTGGSDCSNALPLNIGESMSGTVQGQARQFYRFQVATPGAYNVYTSGDVDTYGQLLDANCQVIAENDDGGGDYGYNFNIERQLAPGTYYVSVRGYGPDTTGSFSLTIATAGGTTGPDTSEVSEAEVRQVLERFFQTMRNFDIDGVIGMSTSRARQYFEGYNQQLQENPSYRESEQKLANTLQWVINDISFDSSGNEATANVTLTLGGATVPAAITLQREGGTWKVATGFAP